MECGFLAVVSFFAGGKSSGRVCPFFSVQNRIFPTHRVVLFFSP